MKVGKRSELINTALSEQALIDLYGEKSAFAVNKASNIDFVSHEILKMYQPIMLHQFVPLSVYGDGNCLYRAASLALFGDENSHLLLRLKSGIEVILNRKYYDNSLRSYVDLIADHRIFVNDYKIFLNDTLTIGSFSDMLNIYALSAALKKPIRSYYPPQLSPDLAYAAFSRKVVGRNVSAAKPIDISVMWTQMSIPSDTKVFHPNHFVTLVDTVNASPQNAKDTYFQKHTECSPLYILDSFSETECSEKEPKKFPTEFDLTDGSSTDLDADKRLGESGLTTTTLRNADSFKNSSQHESGDESNPKQHSVKSNQSLITKYFATSSNSLKANSDIQTIPDSSSKHGTTGCLKYGKFLDTEKSLNILLQSPPAFDEIPFGKKENVYFVLNNSSNLERRANLKKVVFPDDCGTWIGSFGTCPRAHFLRLGGGDFKKIYLKKGQFCIEKQISRKRSYIPMDPQPPNQEIAVVHRYYTTLKLDQNYRRRVTYLGKGGIESDLSMVEYIGNFPGLASHGNSKKVSSEYLRTPAHVMEEMAHLLGTKKPSEVYQTLTDKFDDLSRPTSIAQVRDKKKYIHAKARGNAPVKNMAD